MAGRILDKYELFISVGAGSVEMDGVQYELLTSATGSPLVRSKKTLKSWALSWNEIFEMAIAAGIGSEEPEQPAAPNVSDTFAARDVLAERRRQIESEGCTPQHDDANPAGVMSVAAGCYAFGAGYALALAGGDTSICPAPEAFPWDDAWWKPTTSRRDLVKAAALILAEIERIDRASANQEEEGGQ